MTPKTPTASGISRLLAAAGFPKAVVTNNSRHHKEHTGGFHARKYPGSVLVAHWSASVPPSSRTTEFVQAERRSERVMLEQYAQAIDAAGFRTEITASLSLIVTSQPSPEPAQEDQR
jgi:predicted membrane metal-binding protein